MISGYLLSLEGGGTRSQAALLEGSGKLLDIAASSDVNTNFVPFEQAQQAVLQAVRSVLREAGVEGTQVEYFVSALVGPRFGVETFGEICPQAIYRYYGEREVVFARAGIYRPHGAALVAATGATAWAIRADDGRQVACGGWGALLGDEGSAYALGLAGLRSAAQAYEKRAPAPTGLWEAICQHFGLSPTNFQTGLVHLAYQKPLSRAEIAGVAVVVTRLAEQGDPLARQLTAQTVNDLATLAAHTARRLFGSNESFDFVLAGGLLNAGNLILSPLLQALRNEFPRAVFKVGIEAPAVALGRLALYDVESMM
jgi:N-acetylglucosamine kinase-like BadF-type ATPase